MARRPPLPPEILSADGKHFYQLLNRGEDVSVIVVAVSHIDACLASLLAKRFLKSSVTDQLLDSGSGAIGSFATRSKLAYVLALIDKPMYQDLQILSELRNEVAHNHFSLKFDNATVIKYCQKLKYASGLKDDATGNPLLDASWLSNTRNRFMFTSIMIVSRILLTALGTSHVER